MNTTDGRKWIQAAECRDLASLLDAETAQYRRLLRLAWRQNSYMKRQDVHRLEANAAEWAHYLPEADRVRIARERLVAALGARAGVVIPPGHVSDLLDYSDPATKKDVATALHRLRRTAGSLARQNELNRRLAEFCLDLAQEESAIFRRCVLEDPSGCYGGDAKTTGRGPGGVLVKQA